MASYDSSFFLSFMAQVQSMLAMKIRKEKTRTEPGFADYFGKGTKSFDVVTCDQELEVCLVTYGLETDQSQLVKSVIKYSILAYTNSVTLVFQAI